MVYTETSLGCAGGKMRETGVKMGEVAKNGGKWGEIPLCL